MIVINGFELVQEREINELKTKARLFRHLRSGARLLSLENTDENKVFGITFRTPPGDSTGVAHIMEHAVLCGSQKYPVKEPFVELEKGSLKTFLNAMTFPDKTCYPVASQNLQDFYNLIDVYVDAVFHPLITPQTLDQEGWHYELDDLDSPLVYKGVVFNEMKGAYSSPDNILGRYAQKSLFPDNTYGVDSGGDPAIIPDLTYTRFKAFHATYYQPANSYIYFYGDDEPDERLRRMDGYLLAALENGDFNRALVDSAIPLQPRFSQPRRQASPYDAGDETERRKGMLVVNWLLPDPLDAQRSLGLAILSYILIGTPASPLRKTLIDSGLGEDLAGVGLENDLRQMYFSTGMKGIRVEDRDFDKVEALILETLEQLANEGIDPETVAAALNTTEFRLRENNTGAFPRGLLLGLRALSTWLYDGDPLAPLAFETPLQAVKARLATGEPYFENLIREHLLDNTHRTTVILQPETGYDARLEKVEQARLADERARLSTGQLQEILENTHQLKLRQETPDSPEALATIPSLQLADLERKNKLIPIEVSEQSGSCILFHDLFTNGIVYLDLGFDLHRLPQEYIPYASLFGRVLLEMGTQREDFVRISQRIGQTTGGIRPTFFISSLYGKAESAAWLFLRGKATLEHAGDLLAILREVLLTVRLDNRERFHQMVLEEKADLEAALTPAGHRLVNARLRSFFSEAGWLDEQMGGVSYLYFLRRLAEEVEHDWPGVLERLEEIRSRLVEGGRTIANVTLDAAGWETFKLQLVDFLQSLPVYPGVSGGSRPWKINFAPCNQGLAIPAQINFVGKGANLYELGYNLDGSFNVITNYLRTTWLWEKVRVQGGAYGGFCLFDYRSGVLTYLSYRDPNIRETLDIYDQTGHFLLQLDRSRLSESELTRSIIGAIGDMDAYQLPDAKGYTSMARYLAGETDEWRQQRREQVLSTNLEDFHIFGEALERAVRSGRVVVMGAEQALKELNNWHLAQLPGQKFKIEKVL